MRTVIISSIPRHKEDENQSRFVFNNLLERRRGWMISVECVQLSVIFQWSS